MLVRYDTPDEDGETRRERNERFDCEDQNPEIEPPEDGKWLWDWFLELNACRSQGFSAPNAVTFPDLESWSRLTGNIIRREEIAIIRRMDDAFLAALAEEREEQRKRREAESE